MTEVQQNQQLNSSLESNDVRARFRGWIDNERLIITLVLCLLLSVAIFDFFEDRSEGATSSDLFVDVSDVFLPVLLLLYIWRYTPLALVKSNRALENTISAQRHDLEQWKSLAAIHLKGLSESIDQQLQRWMLSDAEKQIALLLLKGFSLKDIAAARSVSERTVRQQATQIYKKASLSGRAELSAFFLEDLLIPEQNVKTNPN